MLVAVFTFAANVNVLRNGFVFDDIDNILRNPWILDLRHLANAFTHHMAAFRPGFDTSYYRPFMHVIFAVCHALFGLRAWGFHLVVLLVHAATSVAVYLLVARWVSSPDPGPAAPGPRARWRRLSSDPALIAALLFAVHPAHAEAVAWNSGVVESSWGMFFLFALLASTQSGARPVARYLVAPFLFFCALLCKEPAVVLLVLVPLALAARGDLSEPVQRRAAARQFTALAVALLAYLALRVNALGGLMGTGGARRVPVGLGDGILTALALVADYMGILLMPVRLTAVHDSRVVTSLAAPGVLAGLVVLVALVVAAWRLRQHPPAVLGLGLLVLPLLPALYVPVLGPGLLAERYLYVPSAGAAVLLAAALAATWPKASKAAWLRNTAVATLLVTCTTATLLRNRVWRTDLALWTDAAAKVPNSAVAHEYLGFARLTSGDPVGAVASLTRALDLDPSRVDARTNLASGLLMLGRLDEAAEQATTALRGTRQPAEAFAILGFARADQGRFPEAIPAFEKSLELNAAQASVHNSLGAAYVAVGQASRAGQHFREATRLEPHNAQYAGNASLYP